MSHRTTIELDEELLAKTQELLGTSGIRDTVETAMREVVRAHGRQALAERIRTGEGIDRSQKIFRASRPRQPD